MFCQGSVNKGSLLAGKINAREECGGIQRTHFYIKIRCVSDPVKLNDISLAHM